jgi:ceramide glucosyltransferase
MIGEIVLLLLLGSCVAGCLFMLVAAGLVAFPWQSRPVEISPTRAVTILKPLHGDEFGLFENLASFCDQDYAGPVQIVFGVASPTDPALRAVERLRAAFPGKTIEIVVDARVAGSNPKVSNLINMSARIAHEIVVIADSDIRAGRDYLRRVVSTLDRPGGTDAVTCPYYGISTENFWSKLSQLNIDSHFLPSVVAGAYFKFTRPCLGSTIALHRSSLQAIGGFEAVANCLADDYELGKALAKQGQTVSVLPFTVGHVCNETSFRELWHHELRWAMTIRSIDPLGYCGWTVSHPFPLALIALYLGGGWPAIALALAALGCRLNLLLAVERGYGLPRRPYWLIPLRDLWSFAVFVRGFVARDINWRGHRYRLMSEGNLVSERRSPSP